MEKNGFCWEAEFEKKFYYILRVVVSLSHDSWIKFALRVQAVDPEMFVGYVASKQNWGFSKIGCDEVALH